MLKKRIISAILGAGFLAAFASTPIMADVSVSGTVKYKITSGTATAIGLDEAELKFKSSAEASNGWKMKSELELEIKGDDDFDLEEASFTLDMGMVAVQGGILENEGAVAGIIDEASGVEAGLSDEEPGLRVALNLMDGLDLDVTLAMGGAEGDETRIQAAYDLGFGTVSYIMDSAGSATGTKSAMHIGLAMDFDALQPYVGMTTLDSTSETILGLDYSISDNLAVGAELISSGGSSTTGFGVEYAVKPATLGAYVVSSGSSSTTTIWAEYAFK